jgi:hypothetical protein
MSNKAEMLRASEKNVWFALMSSLAIVLLIFVVKESFFSTPLTVIAEKVIAEGLYVQDRRTGLCFFYVEHGSRRMITNVPCTEAVMKAVFANDEGN